jgi:benzoyl-CoA reductase/2-hydroxyglutaryl-CoA dehydratase subunit BcrC/BadD/HgdB
MKKPAPATYWDWAATIAHINFMPAQERLIGYFQDVKDEAAQRVADGVGGVKNERYRMMFDGMVNWNKMGFLARKFAEADVAVICGRYTHQAFWQEPDLLDPSDPLKGMAQHYLMCSNSQGFKTLKHHLVQDCTNYDLDAVLFHSSRTCRAYTNHQHLLARVAEKELGLPTVHFEGDIADAAFYKDEILEARLGALVETIDARRARGH